MFEPADRSRVFACPPGADFPRALVEGLRTRLDGHTPEKMARAEVFVNTRRMQRRIIQLYNEGPASLMPKIRLVTDLANDPAAERLAVAVSPLRRRLELSQLIAKLLEKEPDLAPRSALFDLADSLALLLAEMQDEDVSPAKIMRLDVSDRSGHWQRSQKFLQIVDRFFGSKSTELPDQESRQRQVIEALIGRWQKCPPTHPIIIAGSTGSRGTTSLLMQAVAGLPQGAVILPGYDFELPDAVWDTLDDAMNTEDHPQFRLRRVVNTCGLLPADIQRWQPDLKPPSQARNRLVSLALRPAPVTSQWLTEGPKLQDIDLAVRDLALIEAPSERVEALAIALALRKAADGGETAALVTPDRLLTRRVRAALDRWRIEPDVSAGEPLDQTAPGRLLRHVAALFGETITSEALLILLKHPLVNSDSKARGQHLTWTRELELKFRREGPPFPTANDILQWAEKDTETPAKAQWANWVTKTVFGHENIPVRDLSEHVDHHLSVMSSLSGGPTPVDEPALWDEPSGEEAKRVMDELGREAGYGGAQSPQDYANLILSFLKRGEVRDPVRPHPNIMIWGTLEARVQGADLVILGGLNDGVWPEHASADPWLNRQMRHEVKLLVPERRIGLSAHDFQQAIAAKQVILTRSVRTSEAQTVPSRWLNRLTNLLEGMSDQGRDAVKKMHANGQVWLDTAHALETPTLVAPALRPAPMPPIAARPNTLSVTTITKLIRDPYAVYARYVLGLRPLRPLRQEPDAPLRGTVVHKIVEEFIRNYDGNEDALTARTRLLNIADQVFNKYAPWPLARTLWSAKFERVADIFLRDELQRQSVGQNLGLEVEGSLPFPKAGFTLTAKADRIDQSEGGAFLIYDYKTGQLPTQKSLRYFEKQLLLEAVIAEQGGFKKLPAAPVATVGYIGLGASPKFNPTILDDGEIARVRKELLALISKFQDPTQGYASRRAMSSVRFDGDYDHLARFGEWDETQEPVAVVVGE